MNKKIILSLAIIGVVVAIVVGTTGAWWTDEATSTNTSFQSGDFDLHLSNDGTSWHQNVSQTWDYEDMSPGGDKFGDLLYLRNGGSVAADYLMFESETDSSDGNLSNVMRITKLEYNGKSLLEGGAGATIPEYEGPAVEDCEVYVTSNCGAAGRTFEEDCWQ